MDENITGIIKNPSNVYDATIYKTGDATLISDAKYQNGNAISCSIPEVTIFDTGIIPAGTFAGTYSIGFFYDSSTATVQGTPLMRFEIYEDGVLMPEDTTTFYEGTVYEHDLNYVEDANIYGVHSTKTFIASSTYQIIIKTDSSLTNDAILDYITFVRLNNNTQINGRPPGQMHGLRNGGSTSTFAEEGNIYCSEIVIGYIGGTISAGATTTWDYSYYTPFKSIKAVFTELRADCDGAVNPMWNGSNLTDKTINILFRNNSSSSATFTGSTSYNNVRALIVGYI
jgi:hypothetical protein